MAPGEITEPVMDADINPLSDEKAESHVPLSAIEPMSKSDTDDFADEPDESLSERLWGLTEMFPEPVRNATYTVSVKTCDGIKGFYSLSRSIVWILVSSSVILFAPLIFEVERAQMEDMQRSQQKQMLLGPNSAISGGPGVPMPPIR